MGQYAQNTIGLNTAYPRTGGKIRGVDNLGKSPLDFLFPKFCIGCKRFGHMICPPCKQKLENDLVDFPICLVCENLCINGEPHIACKPKTSISKFITSYFYKGIARRILRQKSRNTDALKYLIQNISISDLPRPDIIIPIPPSAKYLSPRMSEPVDLITDYLSSRLKAPICKALYKPYFAKQQKKLSASKRQAPRMLIKREALQYIRNKRVLLIDDVCTTGSTLNTSAKLLAQFGSKDVSAYALARDLRYN